MEYYVIPIKNHFYIKPHLLQLIENAPAETTVDDDDAQSISRYDYNIIKQKCPYWDFLIPHIDPALTIFFKNLENVRLLSGYPGMYVSAFWFQQYKKNNFHAWHTHCNNDYACVYFIELPKGASSTVFYDANDKEIKSKAKEGELLIFPANLPHCSPINMSDERKTVVAFNIKLDEGGSIVNQQNGFQ